jgi:hypothetical protein
MKRSLSAADRELMQEAMAAVTTEEMKRARESARVIIKRWGDVQREALETLSNDDVWIFSLQRVYHGNSISNL